jgi:hypothetical protein
MQTNKSTTYIFVGQDNIKVNTMHGTYIKIIDSQQVIMYNIYKNTKLKLLKNNAAVRYNTICKAKQLTAKYIQIEVNGNNIQSKKTKTAATKYRLTEEIKFLYCEKQKQTNYIESI